MQKMGENNNNASQKDIGLVFKIALTIIFVVGFSVCLTALLTYFNFTKSYSDITQARYLVLAGNLKKSIEFSMNVGVNLDELENAQALLQEVANKNKDISLLRVVNAKQKVIYDKQSENEIHSLQDFKQAKLIEGTLNHRLDTEKESFISMPIRNNFGEKVGELRIGYYREKTIAYEEKTAWYLLQYALLSISCIAVLVLIAVYLTTRKFRKRLTTMGTALTNLMHDSSHDPDEITEVGNFEASYLVFHEKAQELFFSFDATSRDLDKLESEQDNA